MGNIYDDIRISAPKAEVVPFNKTFAINQTENSQFVKGDNFAMYKNWWTTYPYNAFMDLEDAVIKDLKFARSEVRASLTYLYYNHSEMFRNKGDVYRTMLSLRNNHNHRGDSLVN